MQDPDISLGQFVSASGMPQHEAGLLDELSSHATRPRFVHSLRHGVGDVVRWDSASPLHAATLTAPDDPRTLRRITIKEREAPAAAGLAPTFATAVSIA